MIQNTRSKPRSSCFVRRPACKRLGPNIAASSRRGYQRVTGQLADATGDFACLVFVLLAASARPRVFQSATCPVRELAIRELAYPRVVQLPYQSYQTSGGWDRLHGREAGTYRLHPLTCRRRLYSENIPRQCRRAAVPPSLPLPTP